MILSKRLKKIADCIDSYDSLADIGSDHAYLPIYLIKTKKIKRAIASDVNEGPVKIARNRTKQYKVSDYVEIRKGNGLDVLEPEEVDVIVVAGMGGILISQILQQGLSVAHSSKLLILQPMRDSEKVRRFLNGSGFEIFDEDLVKDDGKIYEIILAKPSSTIQENDKLMLIGNHVIEKRHPLLLEFTDKKINELEKILINLCDKNNENCSERAEECNRLLSYYREVRQWGL